VIEENYGVGVEFLIPGEKEKEDPRSENEKEFSQSTAPKCQEDESLRPGVTTEEKETIFFWGRGDEEAGL